MTMQRKDSPEKGSSRSSTVFKTGAISLVFLVIGYQAALFINRAAILGIEAARDHPDTVYVVRHVLPADGPGREESQPESAGRMNWSAGNVSSAGVRSGGTAGHVLRTDTIRRAAAHSPRIEEARRRTRRVESFDFDPNTVSVADLVRLGFSEKQAAVIDNYRSKGGRFRRKSDFARSFVVSDSIFRRLEPYIRIPLVDINAADSAEFDGLPGIGPYFAAKMVEYRERLGGYSFPEQLMDIYNFGEERYEALKDLVCCTEPEAFGLWTLPAEELRRHPYIRNWQTANAIVLYRENNPPDSLSVRGLASAGILSPEDAGKLARCRIEEVRASDGG